MAEEGCGLRMFPDLWDNSNDFSVVDQLSVTSGRIGLLLLLIFTRCEHSNSQFISPGILDTPNLV